MKIKGNTKRIVLLSLIVLTVVSLSVAIICNVLKKNSDDDEGQHTHSFSEWSKEEPTCTESAKQTRMCTVCELIEEKVLAKLGHDIEQREAKEPTCTEDGYSAYEACKRCSYTANKEIIPAQHKFVDGKCFSCGEEACEEHTYGDWYGNTATCEKTGVEYRRCLECGFLDSRETEKKEHSLVNHEAKAPTCTEDGYKAYESCSNCSYTTFEAVSSSGHSIKNYDAKEPTCQEEGHNAYEACENCSYSTKQVIEKEKTHKYDNKVCVWCGKKDYTLPSQPLGSTED